jgi:hypothetical protein
MASGSQRDRRGRTAKAAALGEEEVRRVNWGNRGSKVAQRGLALRTNHRRAEIDLFIGLE